MKRTLIISIFALAGSLALGQTPPSLAWAKSIGGSGDDFIQSIYTDTNGDIYIAGSFTGTVDFDPGAGVAELQAEGEFDAFFARYNKDGALLGAYKLSGSGTEEIYAVTVDATYIYVAGYFEGSVDFDPSSANAYGASAGGVDIFFGRFLKSNGERGWINVLGSGLHDFATSIVLDASGNVYITGAFAETVDFDLTSNVSNRQSVGGTDVFLGKYNQSGNLVWVRSIGSDGNDEGRSVAVNAGHVWVGGFFSGAIGTNSGAVISNVTTVGGQDGFFQRCDADGAGTGWGTIQSTENDAVTSLTVDDNGNLTTVGYFSLQAGIFGANSTGQIKDSNGGTDIFVARHNKDLELSWFNTIGGGEDDWANLVVTDASSNAYITGLFSSGSTVDFNPGINAFNLTSAGGHDAFITKLNALGGFEWAGKIGSADGDDQGTSISLDATAANVYVAGVFTNAVDADPGAANVPLTSNGGNDSFVTRISQLPAPVVSSFNPMSGTIGTSVTITGTNFSTTPANNTVRFNGTTATVTASTTTSITTSVPQGATTGKITVTVNGVTATSATDFTVNSETVTEPSHQPTNMLFNDLTATSFTLSFTAAQDAPDGYIGIIRNGAAPTGVPVDGVVYDLDEVLGDGRVIFNESGTVHPLSGGTPESTYYFAIYSYNGSGSSINYRQINPLTGFVKTLASTDDTDPVVTDNTPKTVTKGNDIVISINVADESEITNVYLDYGKVEEVEDIFDYENDTDIHQVTMSSSGGTTFSYSIPAAHVGNLGLVYALYVYDEFDNYFVSQNPNFVTVTVNSVTVPYNSPGTSISNYKIISVPGNLDKKSVDDVFGDDLGDYGDKEKWRMFRYQSGSNQEVTGSTQIEPGRGYWLISTTSATLDSGPGKSVITTNSPASIMLSSGWNLIGNPYPFDISWSRVKAANSTLSLGDLRVYSNGSFSNGTTLKTFEGGFVMLTGSSGQLRFPVIKNASSGREKDSSEKKTNPISSAEWEVIFDINNGATNNTFGGFGMNPAAQHENDRFDDFTLPRFFEYLELNHNKDFIGIPVTKDIVPPADNHVWDFKVESNTDDDIVNMTWDNSYFGSNAKQLVLWDVAGQIPVDMRATNRYSFSKKQSGVFKVFYGDENFVRQHTAVHSALIHKAFPNPTTGQVTFSFSVPESANEESVRIEVFDLLGKKVVSVLDGKMDPGYHEVTWDGRNEKGVRPAAGVYVTTLRNGNKVDQHRIIIK